MDMIPQQLEIQDRELVIVWSDQTEQRLGIKKLRDQCPCANCREKRMAEPAANGLGSGLPILSREEAQPLTIDSMQPAGNYAYLVKFSDGHANGIYTFDFLRSLSNE